MTLKGVHMAVPTALYVQISGPRRDNRRPFCRGRETDCWNRRDKPERRELFGTPASIRSSKEERWGRRVAVVLADGRADLDHRASQQDAPTGR
jgi:hypothetical protein